MTPEPATASRPLARLRRLPAKSLGVTAAIIALAIATVPALAPPPGPSAADQLDAYIAENAQSMDASGAASIAPVARDGYAATPGIETLAAGGTNHDWAKMVLLMAGFPMSEDNVTVFTRWMRQENGPDDWFRRNNPLNNGWGSGGGGGLGSYDSLVTAAENAAEALHSNPGYSGIVAAFSASAPTQVTEQAIWASPWATGHYNNGAHWSSAPVPIVEAPDFSW